MFYFDPIITFDVRLWSWIHRSWTGFSVSDTTCREDLVLKIKPVLFQTKNIQSDKVHNYGHHEWYVTHLKWKLNIKEIFQFLQFFKRFLVMPNWQICEIINWYTALRIKIYTTWKSIISSYKICFQNYGQHKRRFLRSRITSSTLVKFELSCHGIPMLKLR